MAQKFEPISKEELKGKMLKTKGKVKADMGKKCKSKKMELEGDIEQAAGFVEEELGKAEKIVKREFMALKDDIKKGEDKLKSKIKRKEEEKD